MARGADLLPAGTGPAGAAGRVAAAPREQASVRRAHAPPALVHVADTRIHSDLCTPPPPVCSHLVDTQKPDSQGKRGAELRRGDPRARRAPAAPHRLSAAGARAPQLSGGLRRRPLRPTARRQAGRRGLLTWRNWRQRPTRLMFSDASGPGSGRRTPRASSWETWTDARGPSTHPLASPAGLQQWPPSSVAQSDG